MGLISYRQLNLILYGCTTSVSGLSVICLPSYSAGVGHVVNCGFLTSQLDVGQQLQKMEPGLHSQGCARGQQDMQVLLLLGGKCTPVESCEPWLAAVVWQRRADSDSRGASHMPKDCGSLLPSSTLPYIIST